MIQQHIGPSECNQPFRDSGSAPSRYSYRRSTGAQSQSDPRLECIRQVDAIQGVVRNVSTNSIDGATHHDLER